MARRRWRSRSIEKMRVPSCHFAERRRPRSTIRCAGRPSDSTHSRGTDGKRDNGQRIICCRGDALEEGGKRNHMPGVFGISNGCTVPALGILRSSLTKCQSCNFVGFAYFGFVLFVFRRIYSHVKQVLLLDEKCYLFFFSWSIQESRGFSSCTRLDWRCVEYNGALFHFRSA